MGNAHLREHLGGSGTTSYIYDADGNRLIRKDPTGKTLYLPGQELRQTTASGAKTCTRFYAFAGAPIAQRTAAGVTWLAGDHQGTAQIGHEAQIAGAAVGFVAGVGCFEPSAGRAVLPVPSSAAASPEQPAR